MVDLFEFQKAVLDSTAERNRVGYYLDMGLGKTFVGAEKSARLGIDVIVVCQKTKIEDWVEHYSRNYKQFRVFDLTVKNGLTEFSEYEGLKCGVINYDLVFRRPLLSKIKGYTLILDESSLIQNEKSKRTKFITGKMKADNVILLSGTPTGGKYENLHSQLGLLGWNISKTMYWDHYIDYEVLDVGFNIHTHEPNHVKVVKGYKNVDRLMGKIRELGCVFLKTEDVFDLPEQRDVVISCKPSDEYLKFQTDWVVDVDDTELVGDTVLTALLYSRMLCGSYSRDKLDRLSDLLASSDDRIVIFYNFVEEAIRIKEILNVLDKPISEINGSVKDLTAYNEKSDAVVLCQYQAGSMGLNLQQSHIMVFFSPPLPYEQYAQARKRIHRIGQKDSCIYYKMVVAGSVEENIYERLAMREDYNEDMFKWRKI